MKTITPSMKLQFDACMYFANYIGMPVGTSNGRKTLVGIFPMFSDFFRAQHVDGTQIVRVLPVFLASVVRGVPVEMDDNGKKVYQAKDILQIYQHYVEECTMFLKHLSDITMEEILLHGEKWNIGPAEKVLAIMKSIAGTQHPGFAVEHLSHSEFDFLKSRGYCLPINGVYGFETGRVRRWDLQKMGCDLPRVPISFTDFLIREDELVKEHAERMSGKNTEKLSDEEVITIYDEGGEALPLDFKHDEDGDLPLDFENDELDFEL